MCVCVCALAAYLYIFCETSMKVINSKDELDILFSFSLSHRSIKSHLSHCCLRVTTEILKRYTDICLVRFFFLTNLYSNGPLPS